MKNSQYPYAVLLRVGLDKENGGIWAPITDDGELDQKREFEFIPIPNWPTRTTPRSRPEPELSQYQVKIETYGDLPGINHPDKKLSDFLPYDEIRQDGKPWFSPERVVPHNDPNFRHATSGEYWRGAKRGDDTRRTHGRLPTAWRDLRPEDVEGKELWMFFAEALAPFAGQLDFRTMSSQQSRRYGIYVVGCMLVREFVDIAKIGWDFAIESHAKNKLAIVENFHFRRVSDEPVIVIGVPGKTRLFRKALPLKVVIDGRKTITEAGKLLGVTEQDQVRFKYIYDPNIVAKLLDMAL